MLLDMRIDGLDGVVDIVASTAKLGLALRPEAFLVIG